MTDTTAPARRKPWPVILLALLFVGPLAAAWIVYFAAPDWRPSGQANYGELIDPPIPLPDLALIDAYLLPNGSLTVVVENVGTGRFSGSIGLQVTTGGGELLGVLDIQETTLLPNRTATVDTGLTIGVTGSYLIELDRLDRIEELSEFNNASRVFLVPTG